LADSPSKSDPLKTIIFLFWRIFRPNRIRQNSGFPQFGGHLSGMAKKWTAKSEILHLLAVHYAAGLKVKGKRFPIPT